MGMVGESYVKGFAARCTPPLSVVFRGFYLLVCSFLVGILTFWGTFFCEKQGEKHRSMQTLSFSYCYCTVSATIDTVFFITLVR